MGVCSTCVCVLFGVLEVRSESHGAQDETEPHLSVSNPDLVLSSGVPSGNRRACQ